MAPASIKINPTAVGIFVVVTTVCVLIYSYGIPGTSSSYSVSTVTGTNEINMKELLSVSMELARRGGERVKWVHEHPDELKESLKGKTKEGVADKLTQGDLQSHHAIVDGFKKTYPDLYVVSEEKESSQVDISSVPQVKPGYDSLLGEIKETEFIPQKDITVWVDPLDATKEYTENLLQYVTVMVCVAVKGRPTMGVVYFPFSDEMVWGWENNGFSSGLKSSQAKQGDGNFKVIRSMSHPGDVDKNVKSTLGESTEIIEAAGAGYKTIQVIKGVADAYVHVTYIKKWDICAGNAILNAIGGKLTTLDGNLVDYAEGDTALNKFGLLATMSDHDRLITGLKPIADQLKQKAANEHK